MSRITWQEIAPPRIDISGLAMSADGIGRAFDRMASMFNDKYAAQKSDATNSAIAEMMALDTPEALAARRAQGVSMLNPKVDAKAFMEALGLQENRLTERDRSREELMALQDPRKFAGDYATAQQLAKEAEVSGDHTKLDAFLAEMQGKGARSTADYVGKGIQFGNEDQNQNMTLARDKVDANYKAGSLANDRARVAAENRRIAIAEREDARRARMDDLNFDDAVRTHADAKAERQGAEWGRRFIDALPAQYGGDAAALVVNTPQYKAASPAERRGMLAGMGVRDKEVYQTTEAGTQTMKPTSSAVAVLQSNASMVDQIVDNQLKRNNIGLYVTQAAADKKYDGVTAEQVRKAYADRTGIDNSAEYVDNMKRKYGFTDREMMAALDNVDMTDRGWRPWFAGGDIRTIPTAGFDFTSGTRRANEAFESMAALQKEGELAAAQARASSASLPSKNLQAEAARMFQRAQREQSKDGKVSAATNAEIERLNKRMEEMLSKARRASGADD